MSSNKIYKHFLSNSITKRITICSSVFSDRVASKGVQFKWGGRGEKWELKLFPFESFFMQDLKEGYGLRIIKGASFNKKSEIFFITFN